MGDPDELQKKDPLGTQIWKLYTRQKAQLPNQERMENLTWRMMAVNLRREREQAQSRYVKDKDLDVYWLSILSVENRWQVLINWYLFW